MKFRIFLKEKWKFLLFQIFIIAFFSLILSLFKVVREIYIICIVVILLETLMILLFEYLPRRKWYGDIEGSLDQLEEKYLLSEFIDCPDFPDGIILYNILKKTSKSMNDEISKYEIEKEEYKQYIETWIHEIKTPIATVDMICKNHSDKINNTIQKELRKIDDYVEQALFYARSINVEKDYLIKKVLLADLVKVAVKKHASQLITLQCVPKMENLDIFVYTDMKWIEFIIGQLISNSIKYRQEFMKLSFIGMEKDNNVILIIKDNGIGIPQEEINRIFDKGFTGENGRKFGKSTGIGLYLCRELCKKMNLKITVESIVGQGTSFQIIFPKNKLLLLE